MTLEEYKQQVNEINEASQNFKGSQEEALEFLKTLTQKYSEVNEFNARATECKDLEEFKKFACLYGIKFDSDKDADELFSQLTDAKKVVNKALLTKEEMSEVSGGGDFIKNARYFIKSDFYMALITTIAAGAARLFNNCNISVNDFIINACIDAISSAAAFSAVSGMNWWNSRQKAELTDITVTDHENKTQTAKESQ